MLIKLLPQNIADNWELLREAVRKSLPPIAGESPDKMNKILESLLVGTMTCWIRVNEVGDIYGVGITQEIYDLPSDTKNLLIYCLYHFKPMSDEMWEADLTLLRQYAKGSGFDSIVAYTEEPRLLDLVKKFGGETKYTFITLGVN